MKHILALCGAAVIIVCAAAAGILAMQQTNIEPPVGMANPAAIFCTEMGYGYEIRTDNAGNQYGVCVFPDGTERDAWEVYYDAHPDVPVPDAPGAGMPPLAEQIGSGGMITLAEAENGGSFAMEVGRPFAIRLSENPTTGYLWTLTVPAGIVEESEQFEPAADTGMPGAGGARTWVLHADERGTYTVSAATIRSREEPADDATAFAITVVAV